MTFYSFQQYCFASAQNKEKTILKWLMAQTAFKYDARRKEKIVVILDVIAPKSSPCESLLDELLLVLQKLSSQCKNNVDVPVATWLEELNQCRGISSSSKSGGESDWKSQASSSIPDGSCFDTIGALLRKSENESLSLDQVMEKAGKCLDNEGSQKLEFLTEENWRNHFSECQFYGNSGQRLKLNQNRILNAWESGEVEVDFAALGYFRSTGEVHLSLGHIWNTARRLKVDPRDVFEIVFVHELAHAIHCFGRDTDGELWKNWSRKSTQPGSSFSYWASNNDRSEIVEGLANWYTWEYVKQLDVRDSDVKRQATMVLLCSKQSPVYRVFVKWLTEKKEAIRGAMVRARKYSGKSSGLSRSEFESYM